MTVKLADRTLKINLRMEGTTATIINNLCKEEEDNLAKRKNLTQEFYWESMELQMLFGGKR